MNNDWRNELKEIDYNCYERLCNCNNTRKDVITMSTLCAKYNPNKTTEECLVYILEWVGDWNGQYDITDLTEKQYQTMLKKCLKSA